MSDAPIRTMRMPSCYLCGLPGRTLYRQQVDRLYGTPGTWDLLRCTGCQLIWMSPQPVGEEIHKLYEDYHTHDGANPRAPSAWKTRIKDRILSKRLGYPDRSSGALAATLGALLARVGVVHEYVASTALWLEGHRRGDLLDVGSGEGSFLAHMRRLGWRVRGVEPDRRAAQASRERLDLDVHAGLLEEAGLPEASFDAITMHHVIEHLPDPRATLSECNRLLRPGGRMVVVSPNIRSLAARRYGRDWRGLEIPRHFFLFSARALTRCAVEAGLEPVEVRTTARAARFFWNASHALRSHRSPPEGSPASPPILIRAAGILFWLHEHVKAKRLDVGEEVVLLARKRPGT